jgi:hypothetical protein
VDLFGEQKSADYETALLIAGPLRVTCRLWPGQPLAQHRPGDLIAIKGGSEWVVMVAGDTPTPQACTVGGSSSSRSRIGRAALRSSTTTSTSPGALPPAW